MATKVVALAPLIHVSPECYQDDTSELRHDIAQLTRAGSVTPDANEALSLTLCFLVPTGSAPSFVAIRQLRQFLQATALSYTVNTETGFVTQVEGLRLQPRTAREQEMALVSLARLDYPAF